MSFNPFFLALTLLAASGVDAQSKFNYPLTEKQAVEDDYFGTRVEDPYRWLEDDRSAKTGEWVKSENQVTSQ